MQGLGQQLVQTNTVIGSILENVQPIHRDIM